jgi:methionine-rich copper-binding protein CopC
MESPWLPLRPGANLTMKKVFATALAVLFTFSFINPANAHAQLTDSNPGINKIIKSLPELVWVEFDGNLMTFGDKNPNVITILDSKKKRVDIGGSVVGGARLTTKLKSGLKAGRYQVSYRVVSEDGHPVSGNYYFTYKP